MLTPRNLARPRLRMTGRVVVLSLEEATQSRGYSLDLEPCLVGLSGGTQVRCDTNDGKGPGSVSYEIVV